MHGKIAEAEQEQREEGQGHVNGGEYAGQNRKHLDPSTSHEDCVLTALREYALGVCPGAGQTEFVDVEIARLLGHHRLDLSRRFHQTHNVRQPLHISLSPYHPQHH